MNLSKLMLNLIIVLFSSLSFAGAHATDTDSSGAMASKMESKVQGKWSSPKWSYGFRIEGMSGYATQWNYKYNPDDPTKVGDIVFKVKEFTSTGFLGEQKFFSGEGKWVPVVGTLVNPDTIKLEAGPEKWDIVRSN